MMTTQGESGLPSLDAADPAPGAASPRFLLVLVMVLLWVAYSVVLGALYARVPPSPDQQIFDYIGWVMAEGGTPYVDAADQNWPGKMYLHAASQALFGSVVWGYRLFDYLLMLFGCVALYAFCRRYLARHHAVLIVPLYQALYVSCGVWFAGQRDIVAAPLLFVAAYGMLRRHHGGRPRWVLVEGAAMAAAVLIRPTLLLFPALLGLLDLVFGFRTGRSLLRVVADRIAVVATTALLVGVTMWVTLGGDGVRAWYDCAIRFNLEVDAWSTADRSLLGAAGKVVPFVLVCWHWILVLGALGAVIGIRRGLGLPVAILGSMMATGLVSMLVMGRETTYHLGPMFSALIVLVFLAILWALAVLRSRRPLLLRVVALLVCGLAVAGVGKKLHGALRPQAGFFLGRVSEAEILSEASGANGGWISMQGLIEIGDYVRKATPADATVLFWGSAPLGNTHAQRLSPTRFCSFALLATPTPEFSLYDDWMQELIGDLEGKRPEMVFLVREGEGYRWVDDPGLGFGAEVLRVVNRDYEFDRRFGIVDCYRRR